MDLCNESIYDGCAITTTFSLPFTAWSVADGTFASYSVAGSGDRCASIACKNDPNADNFPNACSFIYNKNIGARLYAFGTVGRAGGFQATFQMKITCPHLHEKRIPPPRTPKIPSGLADCPITALPTKRGIKLAIPGSVPTTPSTTLAVKYSMAICPDKAPYAELSFSTQAVDQHSAFSTYFCPDAPCNTNQSPPGWFDNSATATNLVRITNLQLQTIYFTIYGWGPYQGTNNYVFSIQVDDMK